MLRTVLRQARVGGGVTTIVEFVGGPLDGTRFDHALDGVKDVPLGHAINVPSHGAFRVTDVRDGVAYARPLDTLGDIAPEWTP